MRAHGDIMVGLNALCRASADTDDVVDIFCCAARIAYCAFADTDITEIAGVVGAFSCLLADKHIGAASSVGVPAQRGSVFACGFGAIAQCGGSVGGAGVCANGNRAVIGCLRVVTGSDGIFPCCLGFGANSSSIAFRSDALIANRQGRGTRSGVADAECGSPLTAGSRQATNRSGIYTGCFRTLSKSLRTYRFSTTVIADSSCAFAIGNHVVTDCKGFCARSRYITTNGYRICCASFSVNTRRQGICACRTIVGIVAVRAGLTRFHAVIMGLPSL